MIERLHTGHVSVWFHGFQKVILRTTSPSPSVTPLLVGEALAGRASPAVRLGSNWAQGSGPCSHWQRLRDCALTKGAGQAPVNLDSGARLFPITENFARPARPPPTRQWLPYQGSWREAPERLCQRKAPSLKTVCRAQRCLSTHPKSTSPVSCKFFVLLLL